MSRKPRSDSKLDSLPEHQREMLVRWLVEENVSYDDARTRLHNDFGVETSVGALQQFYARRCFTLRASEAKHFADTVVQQALANGENFDAATLALIKQKAFERAYAKNGDIDELATLARIMGDSAKLELKQREVAIAERRIALLENKAAQADEAAGIAANPNLTPAEKEARTKAVFGISA